MEDWKCISRCGKVLPEPLGAGGNGSLPHRPRRQSVAPFIRSAPIRLISLKSFTIEQIAIARQG